MPFKSSEPKGYRGRFAPSPTGLLHLGSLTTALGSYLDAKANDGEWLLRIEDIDPPREEFRAKEIIPRQLEEHGLHWDGPILYQSSRADFYRSCLEQLELLGATYRCGCSRQEIRQMGGVHSRDCLNTPPSIANKAAIRLKIEGTYKWEDLIQKSTSFSYEELGGDCIIHRKDGLFSYQLAVAADDHDQGITQVVRGADLLDSTARQGFVMKTLDWPPPIYAHLPLIKGSDGRKLSKQNHAAALDSNMIVNNLHQALEFLGQNPPNEWLSYERDDLILAAISNWDLTKVPQTAG